MSDTDEQDAQDVRKFIARMLLGGVTTVVLLIVGIMVGCPSYNVYDKMKDGQAQLAEAESNRQIAVLEAQAKQEAAKHLAQAEVERAKGVAEANRIVGQSLKDNHEYLTWLWIEGLKEHAQGSSVIYIPTQGGLPVLEAGRGVLVPPKAQDAAK
jgi:predicted aminopeptidase